MIKKLENQSWTTGGIVRETYKDDRILCLLDMNEREYKPIAIVTDATFEERQEVKNFFNDIIAENDIEFTTIEGVRWSTLHRVVPVE